MEEGWYGDWQHGSVCSSEVGLDSLALSKDGRDGLRGRERVRLYDHHGLGRVACNEAPARRTGVVTESKYDDGCTGMTLTMKSTHTMLLGRQGK